MEPAANILYYPQVGDQKPFTVRCDGGPKLGTRPVWLPNQHYCADVSI